ncbi:Uncharacterised protein [Vibrio cincinnatiensis]|uniref:Yip1 domain-containing protein n=1 Tax=Vibrio cincinnatiensis DSM 19608 TaxID=1123491 RepID=A0A1T4SLC8_VIBCI|nr:hypothetical protein SAMN02745782_03349 [Vibrio cincinnatiensis DSM 19608]SUP05760.1 Uncharacterised protein [Vibrio cincinnatiensis]
MKNLMHYFKAQFVPMYGLILLRHRAITQMVGNNLPTWSTTMGIYFSLLSMSLYIYSLIVRFHLNEGDPTLVSMGLFQTIYVFVLAAMFQLSFHILGSTRSYLVNLKLTFLFVGMLYLLNSFIGLPFQIYLEQGGNRFITFIASMLIVVWVLRCWYVMAEFNGLIKKKEKAFSLIAISLLHLVASLVFAVIVPYFVNIT